MFPSLSLSTPQIFFRRAIFFVFSLALACLFSLQAFAASEKPVSFDDLQQQAEEGNAKAQFEIAYAYFWGDDVAKNYDNAVKWYTKARENGYSPGKMKLDDLLATIKKIQKIRGAAEKGDAKAQLSLAEAYYWGKNHAKDYNEETRYYTESVKWYTKSAEQGNAEAQSSLGDFYRNGGLGGIKFDPDKGLEWYLKSANQGYARSQYLVGVIYERGEGVTQDYAKAIEWYTKAAKQDFAIAQYDLGRMYRMGIGVAEDLSKTLEWYTKAAALDEVDAQKELPVVQKIHATLAAAKKGNPKAQYELGRMYDYSDGLSGDDGKAIKWYTKAANQGHATAQIHLAVMYEEGEGVTKDINKAIEWYTKSAQQGEAQAQYYLGLIYQYNNDEIEQNIPEAIKWYTMAAEQGDDDAQVELFYITRTAAAKAGDAKAQYELGSAYISQETYDDGILWLTKSANQGYADAQFEFGEIYRRGISGDYPQNPDKAIEWYTKAAKQGHKEAQEALATMKE